MMMLNQDISSPTIVVEKKQEITNGPLPCEHLCHGIKAMAFWKGRMQHHKHWLQMVGWIGNQFLMFRLPKGIKENCLPDRIYLAFDMHGATYRMEARIVHSLGEPVSLLITSYPDHAKIARSYKTFRFSTDLECFLFRMGDESRTPYPGRIEDIYNEGCIVETDEPFQENEKILIDIELPNGPHIRRLLSEVREILPESECGDIRVQFDDSMYITVSRITNYLAGLQAEEKTDREKKPLPV